MIIIHIFSKNIQILFLTILSKNVIKATFKSGCGMLYIKVKSGTPIKEIKEIINIKIIHHEK